MPDDTNDLELELTPSSSASGPPAGPVVLARREVVEEINAHAREDLEHELGGILLGSAAASEEGTLVFIEASIRALHTDAGRGSVTFTHDTWAEINRVKDRDYPDKRIVGWYHTHPGFGLFLSEHDLFIHRNFFTLPWQVAWVTDPRRDKSGVFVWNGDEIDGPNEFEVVGEEIESAPAAPPTPGPPDTQFLTWGRRIIAALVLVVVLQLMQMVLLGRLRPSPAVAPTALTEVKDELAALREQVATLTETPDLQSSVADEQTIYTVKPGDSLWRIAKEFYGDGAKWGAIAVANGIEADDIEPGMKLILPSQTSREEGREVDE